MKINFCSLFISKEEKNLQSYIKNTFGVNPNNLLLYKQAFIHKSIINDEKNKDNNERLEYLGDAVLNAIIAEFLYKKYPFASEGFLNELQARIVNANQLNKLSRKIGLDLFIKTNGCDLKICESIIGDVFEAFIGAVYLDKGYESVKKIIIEKIINIYLDIELIAKINTNYKGKLLAWSQKVKNKVEYKISKEISNKNRKQYIVQLFIEEQFVSEGCDYSIKAAEQHAAMLGCEILEL
ncbi:MAG: ribonuclease III [Bacteroidales bacterium]|nr:ribonuclease III [Bacteroidales bacterium]MDD4209222.1 ribonuclease III [Bacteroidales bacterium]